MENTADEMKRLQGCINDLISALALPAIWSGHESSQIVRTLLDALLGMLRLDFAYARLSDATDDSPIEVVRLAQRRSPAAQPQEVGRALNRWLTGDPSTSPFVVPNPIGAGEVSIAPLQLGLQDEVGVLVAGSRRTDFPTKIDMLLLRVAANQTAIGLQETRRVNELRRAAEVIRFQAGLLDVVDQAVIATDTNGGITYWNRFAEQLYGWSAPEVTGRNLMDITLAQGSRRAAAEMLSRWQHSERWTGDFLVEHRDDRIFPVLVTDSPICNSQGVLIGVVRVSSDITERKRAEEELERRVVERTRQLTVVNEELRKEIIERQRSEQRLATQYAITRVLAESDTLAAATPHLLQAICECMAWEWGALWNVDCDAGVLRCEGIWHAPHLEATEFDAISRETAGMPGRGLKGHVWQNAEPTWIADATKDPNFVRAPIAARMGLHGAVAFPILLRGETVGVMEFFSHMVRQPDGEQLAILSAIGSQIGQFVERKRLEEEQRKLASLVENSTDFIGIASPEGQVLIVNPAGQKMVGLDGDEQVRTTSMLDYVAEEERERFQEQVLPAALREGRWEGEMRIRHFKTGAAIPMLHHIFFIKEQGSDRRLALATISRDITERKRAEDNLRRQKEILQKIFDHMPAMISFFGGDGRIELVNREWERTLAWSLEEIHERNLDIWAECYPDPQYLQKVRDYIATSSDEWVDLKVRVRDGRVIDTTWAIVQLSDGTIISIGQDITERKQAEGLLREANERVEMILDSITDKFFALDNEWRYTYFNKHAEEQLKALGKNPASLIGKVLWEEFPNPPVEEAFRRAMCERAVITHEHYYPPLGDWVENRIYPSPDGGLAIFQSYVTERKRAEETLQKAQAELAHVSRVMTLGELTASIAHEVNQPLTAVINNGNACLRWLARETPDLDAIRGALRDIITNGQRASDVIAQIRAALKKAPTQAVQFDTNQVIEEVVGLTHREVQRHEVRLRTALAAGLPLVSGDRVQLQQVLLNLLMNGIEAMSTVMDRPRQLLIRSGRAGSDGVLVAVQDSGIGFDPQTLERIFDAFFTTKPAGMGMGLSISRTIIKAHGGQLWAERNPGHGATFHFILPKAGENQDD